MTARTQASHTSNYCLYHNTISSQHKVINWQPSAAEAAPYEGRGRWPPVQILAPRSEHSFAATDGEDGPWFKSGHPTALPPLICNFNSLCRSLNVETNITEVEINLATFYYILCGFTYNTSAHVTLANLLHFITKWLPKFKQILQYYSKQCCLYAENASEK